MLQRNEESFLNSDSSEDEKGIDGITGAEEINP
jgi:hypothetical protein